MKTKQNPSKYVEWLDAEHMHGASRNWLSELQFIKDEQKFLEDLIKSYTLQLIDSKNFSNSQEIVDILKKLEKRNKSLIDEVKTHENKLEIMVDGIDQIEEEEAYKQTHRELIININNYLKDYRKLKTRLFGTIKDIMKSEKQKRLLE